MKYGLQFTLWWHKADFTFSDSYECIYMRMEASYKIFKSIKLKDTALSENLLWILQTQQKSFSKVCKLSLWRRTNLPNSAKMGPKHRFTDFEKGVIKARVDDGWGARRIAREMAGNDLQYNTTLRSANKMGKLYHIWRIVVGNVKQRLERIV